MSSSAHSFLTCIRCSLQRILSVVPVRHIPPSFPPHPDIAYLLLAPRCSMFHAPGLVPSWLQCDPPSLCLLQPTSPSSSPVVSSPALPCRTLPYPASPAVPPRVASHGTPSHLAPSTVPPCPVLPTVLTLSAPPFMRNWYHIPDTTKQHIFTQTTFNSHNAVAERFGISTRTVRHVVKNICNYGTVSPKPPTVGRPRKLTWGDITVR